MNVKMERLWRKVGYAHEAYKAADNATGRAVSERASNEASDRYAKARKAYYHALRVATDATPADVYDNEDWKLSESVNSGAADWHREHD